MQNLGARLIPQGWLSAMAGAAAAVAMAGCDAPTSPSPFQSGNVTLIGLTVSGNTSLSEIGQTSQLTATAAYSDRTTRDVTRESEWQSTNPSLVSVTPTGLITVVGFGLAGVRATYDKRTDALPVSFWPPGVFAVSGRVREPGQSGLSGVRVFDPGTGASALTDREGRFLLGGVSGPQITFERSDYETARHDVIANEELDVPLQRVLRIVAGDSIRPLQLAPHDVAYTVGGERCYPCRLVRVVTMRAGTLRVTVQWQERRADLHVWAGGASYAGVHPEMTVDLRVGSGESVVYIGLRLPPSADAAGFYVPFTVATSIE